MFQDSVNDVTPLQHTSGHKKGRPHSKTALLLGEACNSPVVGLIPKMALKPRTCMVIHTYLLRRPTKETSVLHRQTVE